MASDWIKVRKSLLKDGRVRIVSRSCHASTVTVLGGLVTLWCLADEYADESGLIHGWTAADFNDEIGVPNFVESLPDEWICLSGEFLQVPEYQQHNGSTAKARAQTTLRQKRSRSKRDGSVTREEKRREDKRRIDNTPLIPPTGGSGGGVVSKIPSNQNGIVGTLVAKCSAFVDFWEVYPKKSRELEAAKAWNVAIAAGATPAEIIAGVGTCPGVVAASSAKTVLNPVSFLEGARWRDAPAAGGGVDDGEAAASAAALLGFGQ